MKQKQLGTPILLIAFNRPYLVKKVFEQIRKARPKKLFISVDGPRNKEEKKKVEEVRKIVLKVDWPCKIKKRFLKKNGGIIGGALGAIDWFFENVKEGIILEDDAVPNQDFFRFCEEMLKKYRNNQKIMHINGCNFQRGWKANNYSYYFSIYPHTYGWAMWKKKRKKYDGKMKDYLKLREKFKRIFSNPIEKKYLLRIMDSAYKDPVAIDTKWLFSIIKNKGLCIMPNKNLVKGIGFLNESTHTKAIDSFLSLATEKIKFPLKHPPFIIRNRKADERYTKWLFKNKLRKYFLLRTGLYKFIE